jgi:hypothetical protein
LTEQSPETRLRKLENNPVMRKLLGGGFLQVPTRDVLPPADERFAWQQVVIRNVPGTSAGKLYVCLPSAAATPVWSWIQVATG